MSPGLETMSKQHSSWVCFLEHRDLPQGVGHEDEVHYRGQPESVGFGEREERIVPEATCRCLHTLSWKYWKKARCRQKAIAEIC